MNRFHRSLAFATLLTAFAATPAPAQDNPLVGRSAELLSGFSEGSTFNTLLQHLAQAMERSLPGFRVVFRQNPGGTGALNMALLAEAPEDTIAFGTVEIESMIAKAHGEVQYDLADFAFIGSFALSISQLSATAASGIDSVTDMIGTEDIFLLPVRSTTSNAYYQAMMINAYLGTRIQPVTGYDAGARTLAFVTNETPLGFLGYSATLQMMADGVGKPILDITGIEFTPEFPELATLANLPHNPEFDWIVDYFLASSYFPLLGAPKDLDPEILEALRDLFPRAVADPEFVAAAQAVIQLETRTGQELTEVLSSFVGGNFAERIERALACGQQLAETGEACRP